MQAGPFGVQPATRSLPLGFPAWMAEAAGLQQPQAPQALQVPTRRAGRHADELRFVMTRATMNTDLPCASGLLQACSPWARLPHAAAAELPCTAAAELPHGATAAGTAEGGGTGPQEGAHCSRQLQARPAVLVSAGVDVWPAGMKEEGVLGAGKNRSCTF